MALGNYTAFRAKHVTGIEFGSTALTETAMDAVDTGLAEAYLAANASNLVDLTGDADTENPTQSYAFAKDFSTSGNERSSSEEALLGADSSGAQNTELIYGNNSKIDVEFTCVYRNPQVTAIFNDSTKCCLITLDNEESSGTGQLKLLFNNIVMTHVGSLTRNSDGLMEQKVKFSIRGGFAGSEISCTDGDNTYSRFRVGPDYAEEILVSTD
jgi:hypothetical protein